MNKKYKLCMDYECSIVKTITHKALEEFMNRLAWI